MLLGAEGLIDSYGVDIIHMEFSPKLSFANEVLRLGAYLHCCGCMVVHVGMVVLMLLSR